MHKYNTNNIVLEKIRKIGFVPLVIFLIFIGLSGCEGDKIKVEEPVCSVFFDGLNVDQEKNGAGLKSINIDRDDAPYDVDGYTLTVENLEYDVEDITEKFVFNRWWWNNEKPHINNVTRGKNRFIVESFSYSRDEWRGWGDTHEIRDIVEHWTNNVDSRAYTYEGYLDNNFPVYTRYMDTVIVDINSNMENTVHFDMKPVNGRLAIVVENRKSDWDDDDDDDDYYYGDGYKLKVRINKENQILYYGEVAWYIINDGTPSGTDVKVDIIFYRRKNKRWKKVKKKSVHYSIESGKNITRLIEIR